MTEKPEGEKPETSMSSPFDGKLFIEALQKAGILPENTIRVRIDAEVARIPVISYTVYGDQRLLELVDQIDTENPKPAL